MHNQRVNSISMWIFQQRFAQAERAFLLPRSFVRLGTWIQNRHDAHYKNNNNCCIAVQSIHLYNTYRCDCDEYYILYFTITKSIRFATKMWNKDERAHIGHIGIQQRLEQCEVQIDNSDVDDGTNKYRICVRIMFYTKEPPVWNTIRGRKRNLHAFPFCRFCVLRNRADGEPNPSRIVHAYSTRQQPSDWESVRRTQCTMYTHTCQEKKIESVKLSVKLTDSFKRRGIKCCTEN